MNIIVLAMLLACPKTVVELVPLDNPQGAPIIRLTLPPATHKVRIPIRLETAPAGGAGCTNTPQGIRCAAGAGGSGGSATAVGDGSVAIGGRGGYGVPAPGSQEVRWPRETARHFLVMCKAGNQWSCEVILERLSEAPGHRPNDAD